MLALLWGKPEKVPDKEGDNENGSDVVINEPTEPKTVKKPEITEIRQNTRSIHVERGDRGATNARSGPPGLSVPSARPSSLKPPVSGPSPGIFPSPNSAQRASSSLKPPTAGQPRKKVGLAPGHSPLDWANINSNTPKHILRGVPPNSPPPQYIRVSKDQLKLHKTQQDCWTSINGKVFNITPYINFHPGGVDEIMKCAGRDGTVLFNKYHSWVNADRMLENCMVGILARE